MIVKAHGFTSTTVIGKMFKMMLKNLAKQGDVGLLLAGLI